MPDTVHPGRRLRDGMARGTVVAPGAFDALVARAVAAAGFEACYISGGATANVAGYPDIGLITLSEMCRTIRQVSQACGLPTIVDADTGYGEVEAVVRTAIEYERAGAAGLHIEDQVFPKRASYHAGLEHIIPLDEFLEKIKYALQARTDPDFLIIGRTDAASAVEGDMEEAIRRGNALKELGVDVVMPRGVREKEDLDIFRKGVPDIPLLVIAGADDITVEEYADLGYQIIIYASTPTIAAVDGLRRVYQSLKDTGHIGIKAPEVAEMRAEVEALISLPEYQQVEAQTTEREFQDRGHR